MEGITLDISEVRAQRDFHDLVARVLEFPHYYGRNLDAFWDCLTELDEHTHVRIKYLDSLDSTLQAAILPYIGIMLEYERQTGRTFSITIESSSPGADSRDPAAMPELAISAFYGYIEKTALSMTTFAMSSWYIQEHTVQHSSHLL